MPRGSHRELAEHICRERLRAKGEVGGRMFWDYDKLPGRNDFADALGMAYVLADMHGIGTGGQQVRPQARRNRATVSMIKI